MSTMAMDSLMGELGVDWPMDQPLGLTLFDDALDTLGQTGPVKCSSTPPGVEHVSHGDHWEDPFSERWMEDTSWAELLDVIPTAAFRPEQQPAPSEPSNLQQPDPPSDSEEFNTDAINLLTELLKSSAAESKRDESVTQQPVTSPNTDIAPVISLDTAQNVGEISEIFLQDDCGVLGSPLSAEDVESLLSGSEPSSPGTSAPPTPGPKPISDLEKLLTSDTPISIPRVRSSGRTGRPKVKTVSDTCDINMEFLSKKEKKKIQNKNAAIRYRMKKKVESETIKSEERQLEEKNKTLKDKVEQLQREIEYMKNLMDEVRNAKQLKST